MTIATRELEIEYNGLRVGGNITSHLLTDVYLLGIGPDESGVEYQFVTRGDSEAEFADNCRVVEAAFRSPYESLEIRLGDRTLSTFSQQQSTGLDARPQITKIGDDADSGRSRTYRVRIEFGMPADWNSTTPGLRDSTVSVSYSPSRRRTVTISGTFTAIGTTNARDQYESKIATFATAALTALTGSATYELAEEPITVGSRNAKTLEFTRVYQEVLFEQAGSADDSGIVDQSLVISVDERNEGHYVDPAVRQLASITAIYSASIDQDVTTDLPGKWAEIRTWIISQAESAFSGGAIALVGESPRYDYDENRIAGNMQFLGVISGEFVSRRITVSDDYSRPEVLVPIWNDDPFGVYMYVGKSVYTRTVTEVVRYVGLLTVAAAFTFAKSSPPWASSPPPVAQGGGTWIERKVTPTAVPLRIGWDGKTIDVTDCTNTVVKRWVTPVSKSEAPVITQAPSGAVSGGEAPPGEPALTGSSGSGGGAPDPVVNP